jgi:hypothetical protein
MQFEPGFGIAELRTVAERQSTAGISDDDGLRTAIPIPAANDDGCRNKNERYCSSSCKNIPWDEIEEWRLRVYKEDGRFGSGSSLLATIFTAKVN